MGIIQTLCFAIFLPSNFYIQKNFQMVERDGFEPSKAEPTDLQSVPFSHSGTSPKIF